MVAPSTKYHYSLLYLLSFALCVSFTWSANPPMLPTTTYLKIFINQLNKIDGVEQSFSCDFYLTSYWEDSSVVGDFDPNINWTPQLEFVNVLGDASQTINSPYSTIRGDAISDELAGLSAVPRDAQTWIKCDQRYVGDFLTELNLHDFPFDKQNAIILIESAIYNSGEVLIKPYPSMVATKNVSANVLPVNFEVIEWKLLDTDGSGSVVISTSLHYYPVFLENYAQFRLDVRLQRLPEYYLSKIVAGVILLVYMCIMVVALAVEEADRMMGTLTVFLALVSFTFVTGGDVPKVAYSTRIDVFINFSFFITFFMMLEHSLNYLYHEYLGEDDEPNEKHEIKAKVDEMGVTGFARFTKKFHHRYEGMRTRKIDVFWVLLIAFVYAIGVAIIFGRPVADISTVQD